MTFYLENGSPAKAPRIVGNRAPLNAYIQFTAQSSTTTRSRTIQVLCGDQPPTITDGYAMWTTIPRPLLRGVTVFQGYNPAAMTISVRFGRWTSQGWAKGIDPLTGMDTGTEIENDIDIFGWMAGERFIAGPPPIVYVSTWNGKQQNDLVPPQYHNIPWVITNGIQWGPSWRNNSGLRTYQEASVTMTQYTSLNTPPKEDNTVKGRQFVVSEKTNTALKIAATAAVGPIPPSEQQSLAYAIANADQNKQLRIVSIYEKLKKGISVYVPPHHL